MGTASPSCLSRSYSECFSCVAAGALTRDGRGQYDYPSDYFEDVSDSAIDFIDHLLVVDRNKR